MSWRVRGAVWLRAHPELLRAAGLYALLMAGLELVGVLSVQFDYPLQLRGQWIGLLIRPGEPNPELVRIWERWDALWYMQIAQHGYSASDGSTAFFPLYPGLMHFVGTVLRDNYAFAGLLLSAGGAHSRPGRPGYAGAKSGWSRRGAAGSAVHGRLSNCFLPLCAVYRGAVPVTRSGRLPGDARWPLANGRADWRAAGPEPGARSAAHAADGLGVVGAAPAGLTAFLAKLFLHARTGCRSAAVHRLHPVSSRPGSGRLRDAGQLGVSRCASLAGAGSQPVPRSGRPRRSSQFGFTCAVHRSDHRRRSAPAFHLRALQRGEHRPDSLRARWIPGR